MPVPPKCIIPLGAGLMTVWTAFRLRRPSNPAQRLAFHHLVKRLAPTEQGRAVGIGPGISYAEFAQQVPLRTYADYQPQIERMKRGEADVLWPGKCEFYAISAGTTAKDRKYLPVTEDMWQHFRRAGLASLYYYTARVGHAGVCRGRHLVFGASTRLARLPGKSAFAAYGGGLGAIIAFDLPPWMEKHLYEPGAEIAHLPEGPEKLKAIAAHTLKRDISLLAGTPAGLMALAQTLREHAAKGKSRPSHLQAIWPNLECIVHGGAPADTCLDELRRLGGPSVQFHEVYPAAEGFIAVQDLTRSHGLRLITDAGIFYEFLPLEYFDETRLESLGPKAVPLSGVKTGVDYVLLMTTPAGLVRYVIGDIVRFISTEPPRLIYVGSCQQQLRSFGEQVSEKEVTDALLQVCRQHDWTIINFHVAPLFMNSMTGQQRGRHEWWIELKPGTVSTPTGPGLASALDAELQRLNPHYAEQRRSGRMEDPFVRLVTPGVFEDWISSQDRGPGKLPRCRNDRAIADGLAQLARFTAD